jgi:hypothetical protein
MSESARKTRLCSRRSIPGQNPRISPQREQEQMRISPWDTSEVESELDPELSAMCDEHNLSIHGKVRVTYHYLQTSDDWPHYAPPNLRKHSMRG